MNSPKYSKSPAQEQSIESAVSKAHKLRQLDFKKVGNRKFLVSSYRDLEGILNKNYKYCSFSDDPACSENIIDLIVKKSREIEPYIVGDFGVGRGDYSDYQRVGMSAMGMTSRVVNRECYDPKVKIDGELVFQYQNSNSCKLKKDYDVHTCFKNSSFLLSLEVEAHCDGFFTTNGVNPLLADPKERQGFHKSFEQKIMPPCIICVVAVSEYSRLPSRVLTVVIKKTQNAQNEKNIKTGMIRPHWVDFDDLAHSRSNYSHISSWS